MWVTLWMAIGTAAGLTLPLRPITAQGSSSSNPLTVDIDSVDSLYRNYAFDVSIGSPSQTLSLVLDTTFQHMAVGGVDCSNCNTTDRFDRKESNTFRDGGRYSVGKVSGLLGFDSVTIDDNEEATVPQQSVVVIQTDSAQKLNSLQQNVFGLAPSTKYPAFVENLKKQGIVEHAVVAIFIGQSVKQSVISFGGWDLAENALSPNFVYAKANTTGGLWEFTISQVAYGSVLLQSTPSRAVIDSTNIGLVVPKSVYQHIKEKICGKVQCFRNSASVIFYGREMPEGGFPNLTFTLSGADVTISMDEYLRSYSSGKNSKSRRYLEVYPGNGDDWVLGLPLMLGHYLLFDYENGRLGLAPANQDFSIVGTVLWIFGSLAVILTALMVFGCYMTDEFCWKKEDPHLEQPLLN